LNVVLYTDQEDTKMPRKGHTEEQILQALRQAEGGKGSCGEGRNKNGRHLKKDFSTISARNRLDQPVNPKLETVACQTGSVTFISAEDEQNRYCESMH